MLSLGLYMNTLLSLSRQFFLWFLMGLQPKKCLPINTQVLFNKYSKFSCFVLDIDIKMGW